MKNLSLPEFRDYCAAFSFDTIIFATVNQSWNSVDSTIAVGLEFNKMLITFNPNIIYLGDKKSHMKLSRIKTVKIHEDKKCLLGRIFTVVCGDSQTKSNDTEYTLIIR